MKTVRDLLQAKGADIWSVAPDDSVFAALELMAEKGIGAVLVLDGPNVAGILSERDYARQVILKGKASKETSVRDIMTTELYVVTPERTVEECMALMTDRRVRHLPVVLGDRLVGLLSIGDIVKAVISDKQDQIEQLESYITRG